MSKTIKNLNIWQVLKIDPYFRNFYVWLISLWGLYFIVEISFKIFGRYPIGYGHYIDKEGVSFFLYMTLIVTVLCVLGMLTRYIQLKSLLNNHVLIKGQFRNFQWLDKGYSCITYYFEYKGKEYYRDKYISKRKFEFPKMRKFKNGDELHFIFNPKNPKRNLILELYDINIDV